MRKMKTRRAIMRSAGVTLGGFGLSGTALAQSKKRSANQNVPELTVLAKNDDVELYKVSHEGQLSLYQIDKSSSGQITKTVVGDTDKIQSVSATDVNTVTVERSGLSGTSVESTDITTQGLSVVERSSSIDRQIGDCKTDNGYQHQYKGITFSLTKPADVVGKSTLTEVISVIIGASLSGTPATLLAAGAGIIASAILSLYTGRHYTAANKDGFIDWGAGYSPQINAVVANDYDEDASATTDVASVPDFHLGGEHEIPRDFAHDNPWEA